MMNQCAHFKVDGTQKIERNIEQQEAVALYDLDFESIPDYWFLL